MLSVKQWYYILLQRCVTHTSEGQTIPPVLNASKLDLSYQIRDLSGAYRPSRNFGFLPEQKSFLINLLQRLLPNRERLHRIGKVESPNCVDCPGQVDSMEHLFTCSKYNPIMTLVSNCITTALGCIAPEDITTLNFTTSESKKLPAT